MGRRTASALVLLLALSAVGCGGGVAGSTGSVTRSRAELTNPFLGPDYTAWLIGPVSRIATPAEVQQFLALQDDQQAAAFIEAFWARRDPTLNEPGNAIQQAFERRSADADRLYSEAGLLGRRTDRGTLYVLYGPPEKTDYQVSPVPNGPPLEVWLYGAGAPSGLDGKRPAGSYRFVKQGNVTVLYVGGPQRRTLVQPQPSEPPL